MSFRFSPPWGNSQGQKDEGIARRSAAADRTSPDPSGQIDPPEAQKRPIYGWALVATAIADGDSRNGGLIERRGLCITTYRWGAGGYSRNRSALDRCLPWTDAALGIWIWRDSRKQLAGWRIATAYPRRSVSLSTSFPRDQNSTDRCSLIQETFACPFRIAFHLDRCRCQPFVLLCLMRQPHRPYHHHRLWQPLRQP